MVLEDGETYSGIANCAVIDLNADADPDLIEDALDDRDNAWEEAGANYIATFTDAGEIVR
jgi:hypothetical protein